MYWFSLEYKTNFLKLQQLVLIGGPDDGVITPWQSRWVKCYVYHILLGKTITKKTNDQWS